MRSRLEAAGPENIDAFQYSEFSPMQRRDCSEFPFNRSANSTWPLRLGSGTAACNVGKALIGLTELGGNWGDASDFGPCSMAPKHSKRSVVTTQLDELQALALAWYAHKLAKSLSFKYLRRGSKLPGNFLIVQVLSALDACGAS